MAYRKFIVVGAGLSGCECALMLAKFGNQVILYEQKPQFFTRAHVNSGFAELVCSNSFRSNEQTSAVGLLKEEMRLLDSEFMKIADKTRVPAGKALAVDRTAFSRLFTEKIAANPFIQVRCEQVNSITRLMSEHGNEAAIILAAGPMVDGHLAEEIQNMGGTDNLHFYDAIAPIVWTESLNHNIVFRASRYENGEPGEYLNAPMNRAEYEKFWQELCHAEIFKSHIDDEEKHFEGCMPIEALAERGIKTLTFGPFKPVGLIDPATGKRPWAVLQLRAETANMETCNLVGCQTKLLQKEQQRLFRMIPGLENVEFARYGSMHRNTYLNAPELLGDCQELLSLPGAYVTGQLTGVEGYVESAANGLLLGLRLALKNAGTDLPMPPEVTALGSLSAHLKRKTRNFQPSNVTFGLTPEFFERIPRSQRKERYANRAKNAFSAWFSENNLAGVFAHHKIGI